MMINGAQTIRRIIAGHSLIDWYDSGIKRHVPFGVDIASVYAGTNAKGIQGLWGDYSPRNIFSNHHCSDNNLLNI